MMKSITACVAAIALLSACAQGGAGGITKQQVGQVGGAVVGGVLGSKVGKGSGNAIAIGVGTLLGAMLGNSVGESLDNADMARYHQTSQKALETAPTGQTLPWNNPQTGNYGTVTPGEYRRTSSGQYCREYSQTITVGGRLENGYGTACRQPDGSWQIQS